jgi:hypothetical protein
MFAIVVSVVATLFWLENGSSQFQATAIEPAFDSAPSLFPKSDPGNLGGIIGHTKETS